MRSLKLKRLASLIFSLAILSRVAFASEFSSSNIGGSIGGVENPFGPLISFFQSWITSFVFGALCTIRFCRDIVDSYLNRDEHPNAWKKAIFQFFFTAIMATVGFHLIANGVLSGLKALMGQGIIHEESAIGKSFNKEGQNNRNTWMDYHASIYSAGNHIYHHPLVMASLSSVFLPTHLYGGQIPQRRVLAGKSNRCSFFP